MTPDPRLDGTFMFADFELDWRSRELRKRGRKLRVQQQPLYALSLLVAAGGTVVTRDELRRALWQSDTFVDFDRAINKAINQLRRGIGDDARGARFIETVPKCGYRFLVPIARSSSRTLVLLCYFLSSTSFSFSIHLK